MLSTNQSRIDFIDIRLSVSGGFATEVFQRGAQPSVCTADAQES
jgi:hypothetical protein